MNIGIKSVAMRREIEVCNEWDCLLFVALLVGLSCHGVTQQKEQRLSHKAFHHPS